MADVFADPARQKPPGHTHAQRDAGDRCGKFEAVTGILKKCDLVGMHGPRRHQPQTECDP